MNTSSANLKVVEEDGQKLQWPARADQDSAELLHPCVTLMRALACGVWWECSHRWIAMRNGLRCDGDSMRCDFLLVVNIHARKDYRAVLTVETTEPDRMIAL